MQCSRNWMMSPNIIILVWVTKTSIDHWFIHMLLIVDWLIHICNWLLIGLFITLLMVDWFIYYTADGWLVYLLSMLLIDNWFSGFGEGRRAASFHVTGKKKNNNTLRNRIAESCCISSFVGTLSIILFLFVSKITRGFFPTSD